MADYVQALWWRERRPSIVFELPYLQTKERHGKSGRSKPATRAYEQEVVGPAADAAWAREPYFGDVGLRIHYYGPEKFRGDISNLLKAIEDGMNGIVYVDDRQVKYTEHCYTISTETYVMVEILLG